MVHIINPGQLGDFPVWFSQVVVIAVEAHYRLDKTTLAHRCFSVSF